jgi:hypothetical protein
LAKDGVAFAYDNKYGEPVQATDLTLDSSSRTAREPSESRVNVAEPYASSVQDNRVTGLSELVKEATQQAKMSIKYCAVYEQHRLVNKMSVNPMFCGNATTLEIVEGGVEQNSLQDNVVNYIFAKDENSDYEPLEDAGIEVSAADGVLECSIYNANAMEPVQQAMVIIGVIFADDFGNNEHVEDLRVTEGVTAADHVGATELVRKPK